VRQTSESPSTGRVGKVKKAIRGGVVSVVRIPVRSDLSVHARSTKGYEIEFRALLTDGAQEEVRLERVAVGST
jgi:hypothetical protein